VHPRKRRCRRPLQYRSAPRFLKGGPQATGTQRAAFAARCGGSRRAQISPAAAAGGSRRGG
jgi:hypothetical protein